METFFVFLITVFTTFSMKMEKIDLGMFKRFSEIKYKLGNNKGMFWQNALTLGAHLFFDHVESIPLV